MLLFEFGKQPQSDSGDEEDAVEEEQPGGKKKNLFAIKFST